MSKTLDRYLYSVHSLKERYLCVRAVDVAHDLRVSKASVSLALRQMREEGLILTEPDGNLLLTPRGLEPDGHHEGEKEARRPAGLNLNPSNSIVFALGLPQKRRPLLPARKPI